MIIQKIAYDYDTEIVELEIPVDHIHMVIRGEPYYSTFRYYAGDKKFVS